MVRDEDQLRKENQALVPGEGQAAQRVHAGGSGEKQDLTASGLQAVPNVLSKVQSVQPAGLEKLIPNSSDLNFI